MKRSIMILLYWTGISFFFGNPSRAQENAILTANDLNGLPMETVYLHTDRDLYLAGESIWFAGSCIVAEGGSPSPLSRVLYIELCDLSNKVFLQEKFKLKDGICQGRLTIPEESPTGYYVLRAYTMYLRNFPPEYYHATGLTIINPEIPQAGNLSEDSAEVAIKGGKLVPGLLAEIAIRLPRNIMNKTVSVSLTGNNNGVLNGIKIHENGLGLASFVPDTMEAYSLMLRYKDGDSLVLQLPHSVEKGISITSRFEGEELKIGISSSLNASGNMAPNTLSVYDKGFNLVHKIPIQDAQEIAEYSVPGEKLKPGISYMALLDNRDSLLHLEPVFKEPEIEGKCTIKLEKTNFKKREQVDAKLDWMDVDPLDIRLLTLSVVQEGNSVFLDGQLPDLVILNPFLLESYIQSNLEITPDISEQIKASLILYSRVAVNEFHASKKRRQADYIFIPEIRDVSLSGYLIDKKTGEPMNDVRVFASVLFGDYQLHSTKTMGNGSFVFALNHLPGKKNLYIFPEIENGREHELLIHNDFSTEFRQVQACYPYVDSGLISRLEELYLNHQVSAGFHADGYEKKEEIKSFAPWFGVDIITVRLEDYIELASFREVINEIVPGVRLKVNDDNYRFTIYNEKTQMTYENPLVMIDHMPVSDINALVRIHPSLIEKVEVMNQPYMIGDYTIWGLILITTKTDNFAGIALSGESAFLNYQALTNNSSFTPLDFDEESKRSSGIPFFNTVLYYDHFGQGDAIPENISFYTSDHTSSYDVLVRGILKNGSKISTITTFKVEE